MDTSNFAKYERMERQWEAYKQTIQNLYLSKGKTLKYVMEHMQESYGFRAR
jgi:Clr5 domain